MNTSVGELRRAHCIRRGVYLEYLTLAWNCAEAVVAVIAGATAGSIALVGFGLDSVIEVSSGLVLLWRLHSDADERRREIVEHRALRLVGVSFFALALYVAVDSINTLWEKQSPRRSVVGIALAALSLIVMPLLARAKRKLASAIASRALRADSRQTDLCAYLSAILLAGLVFNATLGWWWADPVAGLLMTPIILNEGREAIRGEHCSGHCA